MIKINKSLYTPEELALYEALIAKATVDPDEAEDEMDDYTPDEDVEASADGFDEDEMEKEWDVRTKKKKARCAKSASPELAAAMERLETLEKGIKMNEYREIAKKYAPLGEDTEELAKSLYDMKEANEANYNAYVSILDKSLDLVEKSGIFSEIGKSFSGTAGSAIDQIEAAATDIQKSDPTIGRAQAVAKAWETHPELIAEYEKTYRK